MNDTNYLGYIIKDLRISKGMTQRELAQDICSVKQLSRIEANTSSPSAIIFSQFSSRLGNSLNDYIPYSDCINGYLLKTEIDELMVLYYNWDYDLIKSKLSTSTIIQETISEYGLKEIEWLRCAMDINQSKNRTIDINYFKDILNIEGDFESIFDRFIHPIEFKFLNALSCLYNFHLDYENSITILIKSIQNIEKYYLNITDTYYIRLLQNLSKTYFELEDYELSIEVAEKGISHCLETNNISLLGCLYLTSGEAYHAINNSEKGNIYLNNYVSLRNINKPNTILNYESIIEDLNKRYNF